MKLPPIIALMLCLNIPMAHADNNNPLFVGYCGVIFAGATTSGYIMFQGISDLSRYRKHDRLLTNPMIPHTPEMRDARDEAYVRGITNITAGTLLFASTIVYAAWNFTDVIHAADVVHAYD